MIPEEIKRKIKSQAKQFTKSIFSHAKFDKDEDYEGPTHDNFIEAAEYGYSLAQEEKDSVIKFCEQKRNEVKGQHSDTLSIYADGKLDGQSVAYQDVINFLTKKKDPKDPPKPNRRQEFG